jgi:hypothetical protein
MALKIARDRSLTAGFRPAASRNPLIFSIAERGKQG